jgi:ribosomal protein S12 methylthiotransferase
LIDYNIDKLIGLKWEVDYLAIKNGNKKAGLISLGCPKNLVDSELMLGYLRENDYIITNSREDADIVIINTCGFIDDAKQESINTILETAQLKHNGACKTIIVAGCLAERYSNQIMEEMPEVDGVVGTGHCDSICEVIEKSFNGEKPVLCGNPGFCDYHGSGRVISTPKGYAYLKIADGCDNRCTYCIIPSLRGKYRSRKLEDILEEATYLAEWGAKEIILVAQDTTRYGLDIYNENKLALLLSKLGKIEKLQWIRILYFYPDEIDDMLIEEIARNPKVCKYIDIPVQHASDRILKKMGRRTSIAEIKNLIKKIRDRIPDVVLRTSLITGFPGEDENDFNKLLSFIKDIEFENLGVFIYSREEGTPAAKLKSTVKKDVKKKRYERIMSLQKEIVKKKNSKRINKTYTVLVEGITGDGIFYYGRSYAEAPCIDGMIYFTSRYPIEPGSFASVKIVNADDYDLIGVVENEFTQ